MSLVSRGKAGEFSAGENTASFQGLGVKYRRQRWLFLYLEAGRERQRCLSFFPSIFNANTYGKTALMHIKTVEDF